MGILKHCLRSITRITLKVCEGIHNKMDLKIFSTVVNGYRKQKSTCCRSATSKEDVWLRERERQRVTRVKSIASLNEAVNRRGRGHVGREGFPRRGSNTSPRRCFSGNLATEFDSSGETCLSASFLYSSKRCPR